MNQTYSLSPLCKITIGATRALIADLQKQQICFIPNKLAKFINNCENFNKFQLSDHFKEEYQLVLKYIEYLLGKDVIRIENSLTKGTKKVDRDFSSRSSISNAIVELNPIIDYENVFLQLEDLGTQAIEFRSFNADAETVLNCLELLYYSNIRHIQIITRYNEELLQTIKQTHRRVKLLYFFGAAENKEVFEEDIDLQIISSTLSKMGNSFCGCISQSQFTLNPQTHRESQKYNSCLNLKISIDFQGNIKNCLSMPTAYGNIKNTTLLEALNQKAFKKYWHINKDSITGCKDCEFRHICNDCRAYVENPEDVYSKPLKCGYNPYTGKWTEWSTNPLKETTKRFYKL